MAKSTGQEALPTTEPEENEMIDWLGRPIGDLSRQLGGWRASLFISGATCLAYFAYGGVAYNLVLYLTRVQGESLAYAANDVTNFIGATFLASLVGAVVADAYIGRIWTVVLFLAIYMLGSIMLGIACTIPHSSRGFLLGSLYVIALGSGSYEPVISSLGGDQFDDATKKEHFFSIFFVGCSIGNLLSLSVLTYVENKGDWTLGFWVCGGLVAASTILFLMGASRCQQYKPQGNPLIRVAQVLVCTCRKWWVLKRATLHEKDIWRHSPILGSPNLNTNQYRWLDKASTITHQEQLSNTWHTCDISQVEEAKCLLRIFPFFIVGIMFNAASAQINTLFVLQGEFMNGHTGPHFNIPPGSMAIITCMSSIIFAPVYNYAIPLLKMKTPRVRGPTTLQRMGAGLFLVVLAMIVASQVEKQRLRVAHHSKPLLANSPPSTISFSIYWLAPQCAIMGVAFFLTIVAQIEFFYTEVPNGIKSVGSCICLLTKAIGSYLSTVLVTIVTQITSEGGGKLGWIPDNLNEGHVDYFYWLLVVMLIITIIFHLIASHYYVYLHDASHK